MAGRTLAVTLHCPQCAFGDLVQSVDASGATLTFVTTLLPGRGQAGTVVSVDVNMLLYAFGMPLFAALTLAARGSALVADAAAGLWRDAAVRHLGCAGRFSEERRDHGVAGGRRRRRGSRDGQREVIAFAYQFGSLILPAVVPAVLWVLTHRVFLEGLRRRTVVGSPARD